ncbi:MAG TPA: signal recognition particle receptor subunit alpha, partial [Baekduia sp.]|nr:signal recognition particle receptor subunit alpha [Baekduia sp.]
MARDWLDLFVTADGAAPADDDVQPERREKRRGLFKRLRENMAKTREALATEIQATLFDTLDEETWERLEEALIMADVGARTTAEVVERLEEEATSGQVEGGEALQDPHADGAAPALAAGAGRRSPVEAVGPRARRGGARRARMGHSHARGDRGPRGLPGRPGLASRRGFRLRRHALGQSDAAAPGIRPVSHAGVALGAP